MHKTKCRKIGKMIFNLPLKKSLKQATKKLQVLNRLQSVYLKNFLQDCLIKLHIRKKLNTVQRHFLITLPPVKAKRIL